MPAISCFNCQHSWTIEPPFGRSEECPNCHRDAKVCRNCRFYHQGSYRDCQESQAGWIKDKEKGNFCDYFEPAAGGAAVAQKDEATAKLDALFGGNAPADEDAHQPGDSLADELAKFLKNKP